jgi:hypothetical protein
MSHFQFSNFDYTGWDRPEHTVIADSNLRAELYEKGHVSVPGFLSKDLITQFSDFYDKNHTISVRNGGFFVSIYSKNIEYRTKTHEFLLGELQENFNCIFQNYKHTCLNYAVKYPGPESELFIHQDMAQVDEYKFSQVGIWIPLVDVGLENGTLGILPYSHLTVPPHRSLYHQLPYSNVYEQVFNRLQPIVLKAGDLFLFDTRLLHNSFVNSSNNARPSLASSVVPKESEFTMTYRDETYADDEFEHLVMKDDFFLQFQDFKSEKVGKPGNSTGRFTTIKESFVSETEFLAFCNHHHLPENNLSAIKSQNGINSIQEPIHQDVSSAKPTFIKRLKQLLLNS